MKTEKIGIFPAEEATIEQVRNAWNNIARNYDEFVTPTNYSLSEQALTRAGLVKGMHFLDVASGSGSLGIAAARMGAKVVSTDISPVMIELLTARAKLEKLDNLKGRVMDGQALDIEDNTFDISGSQFGVMLFPDMPKGIRELARVTRPGGRVLMVAFGSPFKVEFFYYFVSALKAVIPDFNPPLDPPPLPFQLQDTEKLRLEMSEAGLRNVSVESVIHKQKFVSGENMYNWLISSNPVAGELVYSLSEKQKNDVIQTLGRMLGERLTGDRMLNNLVHIGIGSK